MNITVEDYNSNELALRILATIPDTVILTDSKLNIMLANQNLYGLSGYEYSDLAGQPITTLWASREEGVKVQQELSLKKGIDNLEIRIQAKDQQERNALFSASALSTKSRRFVGFICILHDITEVKRIERLTVIGEFAGMIAHDLRNPLQGARNAAYILRNRYGNTIDAQGIDFLDVIDCTTIRANEIINALLAYSEEFKPFLSHCILTSIVNSSLFSLKIPENILINQRLDEIEFYADLKGIQQVFTSVIKNAIEAMPNGGIIEVYGYLNGNNIEVTVSDNGVGIPQDLKARLFKPLVTTKAQGIGFGLAICRQIIEAHGGTISLTSIEGKGTKILIRLPYPNQSGI